MIAMGNIGGETIAGKTKEANMGPMARKDRERKGLMGKNLITPAEKKTATTGTKNLRPRAPVKRTREVLKNQETPESRTGSLKARRPRNRDWVDLYRSFSGDNAPTPTTN